MNGKRANPGRSQPHRTTSAPARWANRRWEELRGVETTDYNNCLALVRASVEEVASALKSRAVRWERDVLGAEITLERHSLLLFRLRGHVWTEALAPGLLPDFRWVRPVSKRLRTDAIYFCVTDTAGSIGYEFLKQGRLVERFQAEGGGEYEFLRERRPGTVRRIQDGWVWPDEFLREQDAFEPGFDFGYFFDHRKPLPGERAVVCNPGSTMVFPGGDLVSRPGIERVDYLVLK